MNWIYNVFNANVRTHVIAFIGLIVAFTMFNPDAAAYVAAHKVLSVLIAFVIFVFATYNHPLTPNGPPPAGVARVGMIILAILLLPAMLTGCGLKASTNPKVVFAQSLESASGAVDTVSIGLKAANDAVGKLQTAGTIEPEYYASTRAWLVKISQANDKAIVAIKAAQTGDTAVDWRGAILAVSQAAAGTDPTAFGIKNPTAKASLQLGLATLQAALTSIPASFGTK